MGFLDSLPVHGACCHVNIKHKGNKQRGKRKTQDASILTILRHESDNKLQIEKQTFPYFSMESLYKR